MPQTSQKFNTQTPLLKTPLSEVKSVTKTTFILPNNEKLKSIEEEKSSKSPVQEINMIADNLFFNPKNITLKKGQAVKIIFQNVGSTLLQLMNLALTHLCAAIRQRLNLPQTNPAPSSITAQFPGIAKTECSVR